MPSRSLLFLLLVAAATAGPSLAVPVGGHEYTAPVEATPAPERRAEAPPPTRPADGERAADLKLPPQGEIEKAFATGRRQEIEAQVLDRSRDHDVDPLHALARTMVNVNRQASAPADSRPAAAERPPAEPRRDVPAVELDEDLRTSVLDVKSAVADFARATFNPRADESGRVSFSVAGIDGFQLSSDGKEVSLGLGGTTLGSVTQGAANPGGYAPGGRQAAELGEANLIRRCINFIFLVVEHPLTWLFAAVVMLGWFVVAVLSAQTGRHNS